jgi:shikimate kinase
LSPGPGPAVVLVGPPGSEVSQVAHEVGRLLGLPVRDTDADVEQAAGAELAEVFLDQGEAAFRELERAAVLAALAEHDGVLAVGGGAVTDPRTEQDLSGRPVVFLDVGAPEASRRLGFHGQRPAGLGNPRTQWLTLMEQRRPLYERVATGSVSTDGRTPQESARAVCELLGLPPAGTVARTEGAGTDADRTQEDDG